MTAPIVTRRDPSGKTLPRPIGAWRGNTKEHNPTAGR